MRHILAAAFWLIALPAHAQTPDAIAAIHACAQIENPDQRLECFDAAERRLRQASEEGRFVAVDQERIDSMRREAFGLSETLNRLLPGGGERRIEQVEMQVTRVSARTDGSHLFVMANGQTWEQVVPASATNVRPGDTVTIRQRSFGSFWLSPTHGPGHRVRRTN